MESQLKFTFFLYHQKKRTDNTLFANVIIGSFLISIIKEQDFDEEYDRM
jgi:hypothetical protein